LSNTEGISAIVQDQRNLGWEKRVARRTADLELLLLLVATPFLMFPGRLAPFFALSLILPTAGRWIGYGYLVRRSPLNVPAVMLLVPAFGGYATSVAPDVSWAKLWGIVLHVAILFALVNNLRSERLLSWSAPALLAATGAIAALSLIGTDWSQVRLIDLPQLYARLPRVDLGLPGSGVPRSQPLFHPREVGAAMAMLLPVALAQVLFARPWKWRAMAGAITLLAGAVLLLSQAVMGLFGLGIACCLLAVWWRRRLIAPLLLVVALIALMLTVYNSAQLARALLDPNNSLGIAFVLRFDMWSRALAMIRDMPLTGIGLNTYPLIQSHFYTGYLIGPEPHAHNLWLQTAVDLGLPGLLTFIWLLVAFFVAAVQAHARTSNHETQLLLVGLTAGVLAYISGGLLDVMTLGAKPVAGLWAMFGIVGAVWAGTAERTERDHDDTPQAWLRRHRTLLGGTAALSLVALAIVVASSHIWWGNWGVIRAQRALWQARVRGTLPQAQAADGIEALSRALATNPENPQFHQLLGSLYAWQGNDALSINSLEMRVALDGPDALADYAPFIRWQRALQGTAAPPAWESTIRLYSQWMNRFPNRAEGYVLTAIARRRQGQAVPAGGVVRAGVEAGAQPASILETYGQRR
jgi:putative inorganic carbon (hco3(-)) transporter